MRNELCRSDQEGYELWIFLTKLSEKQFHALTKQVPLPYSLAQFPPLVSSAIPKSIGLPRPSALHILHIKNFLGTVLPPAPSLHLSFPNPITNLPLPSHLKHTPTSPLRSPPAFT